MKLTTVTHVTLDGVMQGLGAPDEDRRGGFERGGWAGPLYDTEAGAILDGIFERADAFLFGRWTYDVFAGSWGTMQGSDNPIAASLNTRPKYVVTGTPVEQPWAETTVLSGDVTAAVAELKAGPDGEVQAHGGGRLIRHLLANDLVDEMVLLVYPIVLGQGRRLFPETGPDVAFELVDSRTTAKGLTAQVYRPAGRPAYDVATADPRA